MSSTTLAFDKAEYQARLAAVHRRMADVGLELLLVADPANMYYLTGYDAHSYYVPQFVLVAPDEPEPIWIGREMDGSCARLTCFMSEAAIAWYPEAELHGHGNHPANYVARFIADRGWGRRHIGIEMEAVFFTVAQYQRLLAGLPNARFSDADLLVNWVRLRKSDREIGYLREAGAVSDAAMQTAIDSVKPGVRQCDAAAKVIEAMVRGTGDGGPDLSCECPAMVTGERTATPHLTWTEAPHRRGEATNVELGGSRRRYHAGLSRSIYLGKPPADLERLAAATAEGMEETFAFMRPGVTPHQINEVFQKSVGRHGFAKQSRIGYAIGIGYPPSWLEGTVSLCAGEHLTVEPNMAFHLMLGMWMDKQGFVLSESFRITETGSESFSSLPRRLFVRD